MLVFHKTYLFKFPKMYVIRKALFCQSKTCLLILARALAVSDLEQVAIILIIHLSSFSLLPGCYFSTRRVGARALKFGM